MQFGTINVSGQIHQSNAGGIQVGSGSSATRPATAVGTIRFNTDFTRLELNNGASWANVGLGDVSSVALTGVANAITVSGGPITTSGTFVLSLAGELAGINALATTGLVERTGAGAYTTVATLPVANGGTGAVSAPAALTALGALPTAGGSMTGTLTLAADPASALQASTKSYVDNSIATAISTDTYTATAAGGLLLTAKAFSANTTSVTTGIVGGNIAVRSTASTGQTLLSSGTAGAEAAWGALNLASANAVTGTLGLANGGTGGTTAATARTSLVVPSIFRESFTNANLTTGILSVTHSLGQQYVHVMVTDNTNALVVPDSILMTNTTSTSIDFTSYGTLTGTYNVVVIG